jgi:hypothetical protein
MGWRHFKGVANSNTTHDDLALVDIFTELACPIGLFWVDPSQHLL